MADNIKAPKDSERAQFNYRTASVRAEGPVSFNRENRTVEFVLATETPVKMYDWERGEYVNEILLAKGAVMPKQVPLLDTHDRYSVKKILGSLRKKRVEVGDVISTAHFSSVQDAEEAFIKVEEGHLTDISVGYRNNKIERIKKGETRDIGGKSYKGPVNVVTSWTIKEGSLCPIGADPKAKARADENENSKSSITIGDDDMADITEERVEKLEKGVDDLRKEFGNVSTAIASLTENINKRFAKEDELDQDEEKLEKMRLESLRSGEKTILKERTRLTEIHKMCDQFDIDDDTRSKLVTDGTETDAARKHIMELIATRGTDPATGISIRVGKEDREKTRDACVDGVMLRAGIATEKIEDKQTEFQQMSLLEMAKQRLLMFGESIRGMDQMQIFQRALSTSDFDNILADASNKALLDGFDAAMETYEDWVDTSGRVNDFKTLQISRASEAPSFQAINADGGEYQYGAMSDTKESVAVVDYGIIVAFTRKAMVNDDLGALSDIREKLGTAAKRKYGDLVYAVLTGNPTMGDGNSLWDASNHGNYVTAGAAPSVTTLNAGAAAMATQTDLQGLQNLNIIPQFILSPWALKGTVDALLHSTNPVVVGSNTVNPWAYLKPVYDARLDSANSSGWYLMARKGMTVKLFTLNGNMAPVLESKAGWATDGMEFKSRVTAAAKATDWRGMFYNDGVT